MRELHVIALSEDGRSVVLATSKDATSGGFRVAVDARLVAAVRGQLPRPGEDEVRESALTPKDIQTRLRAGESPEQIAAAAGAPVARVERFAGPVASEFQLIITQVQAGHVVRGRRGPSVLPLGAAVELHLASTPSLRPESVVWSTRREEEGTWLVEVGFVARARQRTAGWRYDPKLRSVTPVDAESAAFGHVEDEQLATQRAASAAKRVGAKPAPKPLARSLKGRPVKAGAAKPTVVKASSAKPATVKAAAKPVAAKPGAGTSGAAEAGAAQPDSSTVAGPTVRLRRSSTRRTDGVVAAAALVASPPAGQQTEDQPAARSAAAAASAADPRTAAGQPVPAKGRPSVPAWADVLLGTAPRPEPGAGG